MNEFRIVAYENGQVTGQTEWTVERSSADAPSALRVFRLGYPGNGFSFRIERREWTGSGAPGPSGGTSGYSGYSGSGGTGSSGFSGFSGLSGFSGAGISGFSGFSGTGTSGYSGYSGLAVSGYSGFSGQDGVIGQDGQSGYSGFSGSGVSGYSGASGVSGWSGYSGFTGAVGTSGFSGFSGRSGYSGFTGVSGYSGFSGSGYSGYSGSGISGYSGYSGAGLSGFSGYSGISAYSGFSGATAQSGFSGFSGTSGYSGGGGADVLYAVSSGGTTTSTSLVNLAGLTLPLTAGTWIFEIVINGNAATGTAGARFGVQYSGTSSSVEANQIGQLATTTWAATARITALNTPSTIVMTTSGAECQVRINGQIVTTGAGSLTAQGLKVTSQTLTYRGSSWMRAYKVA